MNGDIILGEVNNNLMLKISNDKISFLQNGIEVAKDKQTVFKKARWSLYDRDNNKSIERDVNDYKKIPPFVVYAVGSEKGYTRLDYETGEVIRSENIDSFGEENRKIFRSLEAGKGFIKK